MSRIKAFFKGVGQFFLMPFMENYRYLAMPEGFDSSMVGFPKDWKPGSPMRMVYVGELYAGRSDFLVWLGKALQVLNGDGTVATLDIYTGTKLWAKTAAVLSSNGCTLHGAVSGQEAQAIVADADVVVYVEAVEKWHRNDPYRTMPQVLADYLSAGKCVLAIGDARVATIQWLEAKGCAVVCTEKAQVQEKVKGMASQR